MTLPETSPENEKSLTPEIPATRPLLDPNLFKAYAEATRQAVADELARRAFLAMKPPSKARH